MDDQRDARRFETAPASSGRCAVAEAGSLPPITCEKLMPACSNTAPSRRRAIRRHRLQGAATLSRRNVPLPSAASSATVMRSCRPRRYAITTATEGCCRQSCCFGQPCNRPPRHHGAACSEPSPASCPASPPDGSGAVFLSAGAFLARRLLTSPELFLCTRFLFCSGLLLHRAAFFGAFAHPWLPCHLRRRAVTRRSLRRVFFATLAGASWLRVLRPQRSAALRRRRDQRLAFFQRQRGFGSRSFGILPFFLPSLMYGP
jgi:hypothetical protein